MSEKDYQKGHTVSSMKKPILSAVLLLAALSLQAGPFDKGKEAFLNNNPVEAALHFEQSLSQEGASEDLYMYLGLSYIQNGLIEKAVDAFIKGAEMGGIQQGRFYLNAGNAYYSLNKADDALYLYDKIIEGNYSEKGKALLNRANIYMTREDYSGAVDIYKEYLTYEPEAPQKEKILQLISLIETRMAEEAAEAERLAAEAERMRLEEEQRQADAAAEAERLRLAEEKRKAEEAARQQALMDEILSSLSTIGEETQNIAADSETIIHTDEDSDIDD